MGRLRYIEPELWSNPTLRRLGFIARDVFAYLFVAAADDEGRFEWEPFGIWEGAFSHADPVSLEDVERMIGLLVDEGMILRYAGHFGFVTGWYTHQRMYANQRRQSARPRPPVLVGTWAEADLVLAAFEKHLRMQLADGRKLDPKAVSYREALRWFSGLSGPSQRRTLGTVTPRKSQRSATVQSTVQSRESDSGATGLSTVLGSEVEEEVRKENGTRQVLPGVVGQRGEGPGPTPPTERTSADLWLGKLFDVPADGLPDPWPTLLPGWETQYGTGEVATVAEIAHGKFCTEATVHLGKVRSYMRKTLENRKTERETIQRDPSQATAVRRASRRPGVPPPYDPTVYDKPGAFDWPEEKPSG